LEGTVKVKIKINLLDCTDKRHFTRMRYKQCTFVCHHSLIKGIFRVKCHLLLADRNQACIFGRAWVKSANYKFQGKPLQWNERFVFYITFIVLRFTQRVTRFRSRQQKCKKDKTDSDIFFKQILLN
jgi:hypothetical protein